MPIATKTNGSVQYSATSGFETTLRDTLLPKLLAAELRGLT
jgi:hypothetical protein